MPTNISAIVKYCNQPILTLAQIAPGYETTEDNLRRDFVNNRENYIIGKHYFLLEGEELKKFKASLKGEGKFYPNLKFTSSLLLFTKKGALMLAKSVNTKPAWQAYDELVDFYFDFEANQLLQAYSNLRDPKFIGDLMKSLAEAITANITTDEEARCALLTMREMRYIAGDETRVFDGWIRRQLPKAYIKGRKGDVMKLGISFANGKAYVQKQMFEVKEEKEEGK